MDANLTRWIDANLNRAGEAVRVLEDVARFVLGEGESSVGRIRDLRHRIGGLRERFGPDVLRAFGRDVRRDPGPRISAAAPPKRRDLPDLLQANARRAEESLRVLEEAARLVRPALATPIERLRFRVYEVGADLLGRVDRCGKVPSPCLQLILTRGVGPHDALRVAEVAVRAGVRILQVREKGMGDRALRDWTRKVIARAHPLGARVLVNDRPHVARAAGADGCHLGATDLPPADAREIVGPAAILGSTGRTAAQARRNLAAGADYSSIGPIFATPRKPRLGPRGVGVLRAAGGVPGPVFAVGGIDGVNVRDVVAAGVRRVAVCGAVLEAKDPARACRRILAALRV